MTQRGQNKKEGAEMFRSVLFTMVLFGGIPGGGLIGGCGETDGSDGEGAPDEGEQACRSNPDGSTNNNRDQRDQDGDSWLNCGGGDIDCDDSNPNVNPGATEVADGIDNDCDGKVDGFPPGGDREPCGDGNTCQDGLTCLTCEEADITSVPDESSPGDIRPCEGRVCTCPQWFEGRWWAEYTNVRAVDYEYDFCCDVCNVDCEFWSSQEIELKQKGCTIEGPQTNTAIGSGAAGEGGKLSPQGFWYKTRRGASDRDEVRWITFTGTLSPDHRTVSGTCDGWYADGSIEPSVFFRVQCNFTLTRQ